MVSEFRDTVKRENTANTKHSYWNFFLECIKFVLTIFEHIVNQGKMAKHENTNRKTI